MRKRLGPEFFRRRTLTVARELLGKVLVRRTEKEEIVGVIVEAEAYDGFQDRASHAHRGRTARNAPMFDRGGCWYVYFVYGMHWMLNAVTGEAAYPAAILIRAVAGVSGPARVAKRFSINRAQNGCTIGLGAGLWVEDWGIRVPRSLIRCGPRIGVDYAGAWALRPYRLFIEDKTFLNAYAHLPYQTSTPTSQGRRARGGRLRRA